MKARELREALPLIAPAVLVLAAAALIPLSLAFWLSLHRSIVVFHDERFIGLANYRFLLQDPRFRSALWNTVYFTGLAVAAELALALPLSLLLQRGSGLFRAAVLVPWAVPTAVSAKLWAWILNPDYGLLRVGWLSSPRAALHAAVLIDVWKTTPFVALLLLAGLQSIPEDILRAARIDGAGPARIFFRVVLPLLRPSLALAVLFRALDAFRVFDAIYVLTEGGPGHSTETLSIYAYKTLMRSGDFGYGATLSVVTFAAVLLLFALLRVRR
jgi:multiple sugar transport system permease protein